jgi:hypothetical protein
VVEQPLQGDLAQVDALLRVEQHDVVLLVQQLDHPGCL